MKAQTIKSPVGLAAKSGQRKKFVFMYQNNNTSAFKNKCVFNTEDVLQAFQKAIQDKGMTPPENIEPGKIIRFSDDGGKGKDGWCALFVNPDGSAGGTFGNWKGTQEKWFYSPDGRIMSPEDKEAFRFRIEEAKKRLIQSGKKSRKKLQKKPIRYGLMLNRQNQTMDI